MKRSGTNTRFAAIAIAAIGACTNAGDDDATDGGLDGDASVSITATRYPPAAIVSPVTASVVARLSIIAQSSTTTRDDVFAKIGDSHTVSSYFLHCFAGDAGSPYTIDLDGRDAVLEPTRMRFRAWFDRTSLAAEVGRSARWAITGTPSPLAQELAATTPSFAFVAYGSNDMQLGTTYASALPGFWDSMNDLLDQVVAAGAIPIVVGLPPRSDLASAARWVPTYDAVTRAIAEARQVPYISMFEATRLLPSLGLGGDGLHHNVYVAGGAQPCILDATGLMYGNNTRNLHHLEALATTSTILDGATPEDDILPPITGTGTSDDPFEIDILPFTHTFDTTTGERLHDSYPACDTGQDESGPEIVYRLTLPAAAAIRVIALDRAADVDVHVLDATGTCVERNDRLVDRALPAGEHTIVVDTFVSGGLEQRGAYTLVVLACEAGDADCAAGP
jgi:hypothetical protein